MHYQIENIIDDYNEIERLFSIASKDDHRNSKNYLHLENRYEKYVAFHVLYDEDGPVSFCGMYQGWNNLVRILDRFFIFKRLRKYNINSSIRPVKPAGRFFIPEQTRICKELNVTPFFSIQELRRRGSVQIAIDGIEGDHDYRLLDGMYFTCHKSIDMCEECWQNVASTVDQLSLPNISLEQAKLLFR